MNTADFSTAKNAKNAEIGNWVLGLVRLSAFFAFSAVKSYFSRFCTTKSPASAKNQILPLGALRQIFAFFAFFAVKSSPCPFCIFAVK